MVPVSVSGGKQRMVFSSEIPARTRDLFIDVNRWSWDNNEMSKEKETWLQQTSEKWH